MSDISKYYEKKSERMFRIITGELECCKCKEKQKFGVFLEKISAKNWKFECAACRLGVEWGEIVIVSLSEQRHGNWWKEVSERAKIFKVVIDSTYTHKYYEFGYIVDYETFDLVNEIEKNGELK